MDDPVYEAEHLKAENMRVRPKSGDVFDTKECECGTWIYRDGNEMDPNVRCSCHNIKLYHDYSVSRLELDSTYKDRGYVSSL